MAIDGSTGPTAAKPAVPTMPPQPPASAEESCLGISWAKFDRSRGAGAPPDMNELPTLQCFGARANRVLAASAWRAHTGGGAARSEIDVSAEAWELVCAGRFSILAPAFAASAADGAGHGAGVASTPAAATPAWPIPRARCSGVMLRLDAHAQQQVRRGAETASRSRAPDPPAREPPSTSSNTDGNRPGIGDQQTSLPSPNELGGAWIRGMGAVAVRAGAIVSQVETAGLDPGPVRLITNTGIAAGRICRRAAKIALRSAEHVGRIASRPFEG